MPQKHGCWKKLQFRNCLVFKRKILGRIFGPTKENQIWIIKTDEELDKLIKHKNIVNYIKAHITIAGLVTCKECQIPEQLRRYLIGNPWPKGHKEDPSTEGRITPNRTFAKWRSEIGQLASRIERNGRRRSLRRAKLPVIKESSAPGRKRRSKMKE